MDTIILNEKIELNQSLVGRSVLTLFDFTPDEIGYLLQLSMMLKHHKRQGQLNPQLVGKNAVFIFDKPSTRTRCAAEVAAFDEGMGVTYLSHSHMGKKESLEDTAKVFGRYYDAILYRGFGHDVVENLAKFSNIPVYNGLTDEFHPTQALADLLTIHEHVNKPKADIKITFVGDVRNNVACSLAIAVAKMGMQFVGLGPQSLFPDEGWIKRINLMATEQGGRIAYSSDFETSLKHSDVIYTDVWFSMGEEDQISARVELLQPYQVNSKMMAQTGNDRAIFMHCLPAFHDDHTEVATQIRQRLNQDIFEVSDEVFRSSQSVVFDQAENRMHTIKAILVATLKG